MTSLGKELYETRKRQGKTLLEVEKATKIPSKYIQALENEQFDLLPGGVYTKGFIRTYANYLGLDPYPLVEEYKKIFEKPSNYEPKVSPLTPSPSKTRRQFILTVVFLVALAILIAFLAWLGSTIRW